MVLVVISLKREITSDAEIKSSLPESAEIYPSTISSTAFSYSEWLAVRHSFRTCKSRPKCSSSGNILANPKSINDKLPLLSIRTLWVVKSPWDIPISCNSLIIAPNDLIFSELKLFLLFR